MRVFQTFSQHLADFGFNIAHHHAKDVFCKAEAFGGDGVAVVIGADLLRYNGLVFRLQVFRKIFNILAG